MKGTIRHCLFHPPTRISRAWLLASQRYTFPRQATLPDAIFQHKFDQREHFYKQEKKKLGVEFNKKH